MSICQNVHVVSHVDVLAWTNTTGSKWGGETIIESIKKAERGCCCLDMLNQLQLWRVDRATLTQLSSCEQSRSK